MVPTQSGRTTGLQQKFQRRLLQNLLLFQSKPPVQEFLVQPGERLSRARKPLGFTLCLIFTALFVGLLEYPSVYISHGAF